MLESDIKIINKDDKKDLILRLSRVEGQIRGIIKMIEKEENCEYIIHQLAATNQALHKVFTNTISKALKNSLTKEKEIDHDGNKVVQLTEIIEKYL